MKISWFFWWLVTVFWLVLFASGTVFVWVREVDGAGAFQTPEIKFISFIVLLFAFLFPVMIQISWLVANIVVSKKKQSYMHKKKL